MKSQCLGVWNVDEDEKTDLMDYLPAYLKNFHEIKEIMGTENAEFWKFKERHSQCVEDCFILTCGPYGMERYEKLFGIAPSAEKNLEVRRQRLMARWNNMVPYNYVYLENKLDIVCGIGGYRLHMDFHGQKLELKIGLASKGSFEVVKELLDSIVPCNILTDIGLLYNQHKTLRKFTHRQLSGYTYKQLREEVVL